MTRFKCPSAKPALSQRQMCMDDCDADRLIPEPVFIIDDWWLWWVCAESRLLLGEACLGSWRCWISLLQMCRSCSRQLLRAYATLQPTQTQRLQLQRLNYRLHGVNCMAVLPFKLQSSCMVEYCAMLDCLQITSAFNLQQPDMRVLWLILIDWAILWTMAAVGGYQRACQGSGWRKHVCSGSSCWGTVVSVCWQWPQQEACRNCRVHPTSCSGKHAPTWL